MSEWRLTTENPLRNVAGLDHERCAALHNLILERGWIESGRASNDLDRRTWWECFDGVEELERHATKLEPTLVAFLQAAWHGFAISEPTYAWFRYLAVLCSPEQMWENVNYGDDEDDSNKRCYITLYMANWALGASHPLGLVFDQQTCTAMQHISLHDSSITMNGRQTWLPLELILEGYLDMMDQEKVVAIDHSYDGDQERIEPWIMPSYTEQDLRDTIEAFDRLVGAIESLMESDSLSMPVEQAHKPRFTHIAPGLRVAQQQPISSESIEEGKLRPLLLFEGFLPAFHEFRRAPWGEDVPISPFPNGYQIGTTYPAGLYLTEMDSNSAHPFEDGCKLLLPFPIGGNGFACTSDGALFGENKQAKGQTATPEPRSSELYQLGFNHFIKMHDVQLKRVLWRWAEIVEEGKWKVDAHGVIGGLEKWKEADTEEHWRDYQLPVSW